MYSVHSSDTAFHAAGMEPQSAGRRLLFRDGWWIFDQISDKRWKLNLISDRILNLISDRILNLKTGRIPDIWQIIRPYTGVRSDTLSLTHSFIFFPCPCLFIFLSLPFSLNIHLSFFIYLPLSLKKMQYIILHETMVHFLSLVHSVW